MRPQKILSAILGFVIMSVLPLSQEKPGCLFCQMIKGDAPCYKVWESETHLAFLSIFPNTPGVSVVVPKKHFDSYAFHMNDEDYIALMGAAKKVALILDEKLKVARTALVLEGFGVNHVHAKLFPLHGPKASEEWQPIQSGEAKKEEFFTEYQGYISSHDSKRAQDTDLQNLVQKISID